MSTHLNWLTPSGHEVTVNVHHNTEPPEPDVYYDSEHGMRAVSAEQLAAFVEAAPKDTQEYLRQGWFHPLVLGDVVDGIRDFMQGYARKCQSRPALPHEDGGRYHTRKGTVKYTACLEAMAAAFEKAFGLEISGRDGGPLDPLSYE